MIKIKARLLCIIFCISNYAFATNTPPSETTPEDHDIHISKCLIDYNPEDEALQISVHIFLDDLEEILAENGAKKLYICTPKEKKEAEKFIYLYLQKQFNLKVDDKAVAYNFIGKESSEDLLAVWCYLEVPKIKSPQSLEISSKILMDLYDDQLNIINVNYPGKKNGYLMFHKGEFRDVVVF